MDTLLFVVALGVGFYAVSYALNWLSYRLLKNRIVRYRKWDLNICCGKTGYGGVNADIFQHEEVRNFVLVKDIYNLPFRDAQFDSVLCSHTLEHVDDPQRFHRELLRVGRRITYIVPPLWDITAAFNILEHKWLFLTFVKEHHRVPKYVKLPLASGVQNRLGQRVKA